MRSLRFTPREGGSILSGSPEKKRQRKERRLGPLAAGVITLLAIVVPGWTALVFAYPLAPTTLNVATPQLPVVGVRSPVRTATSVPSQTKSLAAQPAPEPAAAPRAAATPVEAAIPEPASPEAAPAAAPDPEPQQGDNPRPDPQYPTDPWTPMAGGTGSTALAPIAGTASIPLNTSSWTAFGPASLATTSPANASSYNSGRITGIAADPGNANTIYIATAGGGVWKTTDGGSTWSPLTDTQSTLSMGAIAVAPSNPSVLYAGTGEANNAGDSNYGLGILTSTDGGSTWTLRTGPAGIFSTNRLTTAQIAIDPTNANIAYAAMADFGVNGIFALSSTGVYKTIDGGVTWTNMTTAVEALQPWSAVVVDPTTPSTIYAAVGRHSGVSTNGVYKSTNSGTSWSLLSNAPNGTSAGRISIAVSKSNSLVVYVIAATPNTGVLSKIERSDDGGSTFTDLTAGTPNFMSSQGWYDQYVTVDPSNSAIVYVAGSAGTNSILRSNNSGASWTDIHGGSPSPHADHHAAAFDANGKMLDGDDGGIYRLDSPTVPSWSNLNNNLNTIQFQGIGLHPTNANQAIGGSQDNGTELFSGTTVWTEWDGGDGGFAKFSPTSSTRAYHQIPTASFGSNFFRRSDDGGSTWFTKTSSIVSDLSVQNFYAPFAVDPINGDHVLYGTNRVWETLDGGDTWTAVSAVGTNGFNNTSGQNVDTVAIAPSDHNNTVYAATGGTFAASSKIFVTINHGASWTEHDLPVSGRVNEIQVDPSNSLIAYAVINRFNSPNGVVYKTSNGGTSWTNISGNLPAEPVWSLQINANALYVGADDGVYSSTNGGTTWSRLGLGFPSAQVFQLEFNNGLQILAAGTHGRGMWEIALSAPGTNSIASVTPASPVSFGNQLINTTGTATTFTVSNTGTGTLDISNIALGGTNASEFLLTNTGTCATPATVTAGNNCTFTIAFKPTTTGPKTATVTVTDDSGGAANSTQVVTLNGTAISATITFDNHTGGGTWIAGNFDLNRLPAIGDLVSIPSGSNVTVGAGVTASATTMTMQGNSTLTVSGSGTLALTSPSTLTTLTQSGTGSTALNNSPNSATGITTVSGILTLSGGTLNGQGQINVNGSMSWTGGTLTGTSGSVLQIAAGHTLSISAPTSPSFLSWSTRTIQNAGTVTLTGSNPNNGISGGASLINQAGGLLDFQSDVGFFGTSAWTNAGTIQKSGGGFNFAGLGNGPGNTVSNTGTIHALAGTGSFGLGATYTQTAGSLTVDGSQNSFTQVQGTTFSISGGSVVVASNAQVQGSFTLTGATLSNNGQVQGNVTVNGSTLSGNGQIQGNLTNNGTVNPGNSPGLVTIGGNYTQTSSGVLNIEIGGNTLGGYDVLAINGTATLNGTLNVTSYLGFAPTPANSFAVLAFASKTGDFSSFNNAFAGLTKTYTSNSLTLAGSAGPGTLTLGGATTDFGSQTVWTTGTPLLFTLSNPGPGDITITGFTVTGSAGDKEFDADQNTTCPLNGDNFTPFPILASGSCNIELVFTPEALGPRSITVTFFASNSTVSSASSTITGTGLAGAAASLTATGGGGQNTIVSTAFAAPLLASVRDTHSVDLCTKNPPACFTPFTYPVSGTAVTFTISTGGASGTFTGGGTVALVSTDANGIATAPTITANGTTGNFTVTASSPGLTSVVYSLENFSAGGAFIQTIAGGGSGATPSICAQNQVGGTFGGNIYFKSCAQVFKMPVGGGAWTLVAGNGIQGYSGDGGDATQAEIGGGGIFVDSTGNVFLADGSNNRVREVFATGPNAGKIQTIAGTGTGGYNADNVPGTAAQLSNPQGVFVTGSGSVIIADSGNNRIRAVISGIIETIAGSPTGVSGFNGDGCATCTNLSNPQGVYVDGSNNVWFADTGANRIRELTGANITDTNGNNGGGNVTTIIGNGSSPISEGVAGTSTGANAPQKLWFDSLGNLIYTDSVNNLVRKASAPVTPTSLVNTFVGVPGSTFAGYTGDGGSATSARTFSPSSLFIDGANNVYFASFNGIRKVTSGGSISTLIGNSAFGSGGDGGAATSAQLFSPNAVARDQFGNIYIADDANYEIRKVDGLTGKITTIAGDGVPGQTNDGVVGAATTPGTHVRPNAGIAADLLGNVYFVDRELTSSNTLCEIRKIDTTTSTISRLAGNGINCTSGPDGTANTTGLGNPSGVAVDASNNVYVSQGAPAVVRIINMQSSPLSVYGQTAIPVGAIKTIAGGGASLGDGGAATSGQLSVPQSVAFDGSGNMYIPDSGNLATVGNRVRIVNSGGTINTFAGTGVSGFNGDNLSTTVATLSGPSGVAVDPNSGAVYIADNNAFRIRKVAGGTVTTVALNGIRGFSGDGGLAVSASASQAPALAIDAAGNGVIVDRFNARIRYVGATNLQPTITSPLSPTNGVVGVGFALTVTGTNFVPNTFVSFGLPGSLAPYPTTFNSSTSVTAQIPASAVAATGTYNVATNNPIPGGGTSGTLSFTVTTPTITFTGGAGGTGTDWATAANWDLARVPTAGDTVVIGSAFSPILSSTTPTIAVLTMTSTGTLTINGTGTLIITGAGSTATNITIGSGGTLTANGTLSSSGTFTLSSGGTLNGTGDVTVGSPLVFTGGTMSASGNFFLNGPGTWSGGTMSGSGKTKVNGPSGALTWSGGALSRTLQIASGGVATDSASSSITFTGATLQIDSGGTFHATGSGGFTGSGTITNSGAFDRTAFGPPFAVSSPIAFNNNGTLSVSTLTAVLDLLGGGTSNGTFNVATGTVLEFGSATTLASGSTVTGLGTGQVNFLAGTASVAGTYTVAGTTAISNASAIVNFNSTSGSTGNLTLSNSGTLAGTGNLTVNGTMTFSSGTLSNTGSTTISGTGTLNWTGGTASGAGGIGNSGTATISGGTLDTKGFSNGGTLTFPDTAAFSMANGATFANQTTGTVNISGAGSITRTTGSNPVFNNSGTFNRNGAAGTFTMGDVNFTNNNAASVLNITAGELNFNTQSYSQSAGRTTVNGGNLRAVGSSITGGIVNGVSTILNGSGTMNVSGTGRIQPGLSPGILNVSSVAATTLSEGSTATFDVELGGTTVGTQYDQLAVAGSTALNGTLNVTLINSFTPNVGDSFTILTTTGSRGGTFSTVNLPSLPSGKTWAPVAYNPSNVTISVTGVAGTDTFNNVGGDGLWTNPANWDLGRIPIAGDTVVINGVAANSSSVTLSSGAQTINVLNMSNSTTLTISGGGASLTTTGASTATSITISSGTLTANAALTISGTLSMTSSSATLNGSGTVTLNSGSTLSFTGGSMSGTGTTISSGTVSLVTSGAASPSISRILEIASGGVATQTGSAASFAINAPGQLKIDSGGTFNASSDTGSGGIIGGSGGTISNAGTFNRTAGTSLFIVHSPVLFNSSGSVNVSGGLGLSLEGGGTSGGSFSATGSGSSLQFGTSGPDTVLQGTSSISVGAGANLNFGIAGITSISSGTFSVLGTTSISGSGTTVNFNSSSGSTANLTLSNGALAGGGNLTVTGAMTFSGGTLSNLGTTTVAGTGTLTWSGGTRSATGTLANAGSATISASSTATLDGGTFSNTGTLNFAGSATFAMKNGATLINQSAGTINANIGSITNPAGAAANINNAGTFNAVSGTLTLGTAVNYTNSGATNINGGSLSLTSNYVQTSGTTTLTGPGTLTAPATQINAGTIKGVTTVTGTSALAALSVAPSGIVAPGLSPGILTVTNTGGGNSYSQGTGTLSIEIAGTTLGSQYDQLNLTGGGAALSGTLKLTLNSFTPAIGNSFTVVNSALPISGVFGTVDTSAAALPAGRGWSAPTYNANSVVLSVVAVPGTITFTNGGGDNLWTNPANWDFGRIPISGDTVNIPGTFNVTLNDGASYTIAVLNMTSTGTLTISNNPTHLTITAPSTATNLSIGPANTGGIFTANNTLSISGTLTMPSGVLGGSGNVTSSGTFNMSGTGNLGGSGIFTSSGTANITGGAIGGGGSGKTFNNTGTANVVGLALNNSSAFNNSGTVNATANGSGLLAGTTTPGAFTNLSGGTMTVNPGSSNAYIVSGIAFNNAGTLSVNSGTLQLSDSTSPASAVSFNQTGGLTQIASGANIASQAVMTIAGGTLGGFGTITPFGGSGGVSNTGGIVAPGASPGAFGINPSYTQGAGGSINIELSGTTAGSQYDQLNVTGAPGTATLGGTLNVALLSFTPALGNSFTVIQSAGSISGTFTTKNLPALAAGLSWRTTYNNPAPGSVVLDVVAANLTLAPNPLDFGNQQVGVASAALTLTLTNSGGLDATLGAGNPISFTGSNPGDFATATGTTCVAGFVVTAGGGTCIIKLTFTPGGTFGRSAVINVASNALVSPTTASVTGTGMVPFGVFSPASPWNFGSQALNTSSASKVITLSDLNPGTTLHVTAVASGGTDPGQFIFDTTSGCTPLPKDLPFPAGFCTFTVTFHPTAQGAKSATITVTDNHNNVPGTLQVFTFNGTGVVSAVTLNPSPVDFGNQKVGTPSATATVTVTNTGGLDATLGSGTPVTIINGNFSDFAIVGGTTCTANLLLTAGGGSCVVKITFTAGLIGPRTATLNIVDNDPNSPQQATLNGVGVLANVTVTPPLVFPARINGTTSSALTVTVTNTGTLAATLAASTPVTFGGTNPGDFAIVGGTTTCVASFVLTANSGNSCVINVTFTPGASGARSATLNVADDAPASPQSTSLSGTGQSAPTADLTTLNIPFGNKRVGTSTAATVVTLTNNGQASLSVASLVLGGTDPLQFVLTAGGGAGPACTLTGLVVAGGASCTFSATFSPTATGAKGATVTITDNANATGALGASQQVVTLSGTGIQALVTMAPSPGAFANQRVGTPSAPLAITVTNSGTDIATLAGANAISVTGANASEFVNAGTGTCVNGFVLAASPGPGNTCTINLVFTPTATGPRAATLSVADDAPGSPQTDSLTGTGIQALLTLAPNPAPFGSLKVGTPSAPVTVTLTNTGTDIATLAASNAVTIGGTNAADFISVGTTTCTNGKVLAASPGPGNTCKIDIVFTPGATGARTATVSVADDAPASPQSATLNGTGVLANVTVAPPLAFPARINGTTSSALTVTVTNTGTLAATLASSTPATIGGTNPGDFAIVGGTTTCVANFVLAANSGNSCVINVTFTPGASGARSATLNVADDAPASPQSTTLSGTGQTAPTATLSTLNIPFGNKRVGTSTAATVVTMTNNGQADLTYASIVLGGTDPSQFVLVAGGAPGPACTLSGGVILGGTGASCTFSVTFSPTSTLLKSAKVTISHNGNATGTPGTLTDVTLSGTGIQALVTMAPSPRAFGNQRVGTTSAPLAVTVTNNGTDIATLTGTPVTITGGNAADFAIVNGTTTCVANFVLTAGGGSCVINITFTPGATLGRAATLNVADDAPGSPQTDSLTGTGIQALLTLAPNPAGFGTLKVGTPSAPVTVTVTNTGTDVATLAASNAVTIGGANAADFVSVGTTTCTNGLALTISGAGSSCKIDIVFTPGATGARTATVSVADDAPGTPQSATLNGTGALASLTLTPNPLNFGGVNLGANNTMSVTVTNTGGLAATITAALTVTGTNSADFTQASGTTCVNTFVIAANGGSCVVNLTFAPLAPLAPTARTATLNLSDSGETAGASPHVVTLSGTATQPGVTLSTKTEPNFGNVQVGTTVAGAGVTLTNSGTGPLKITNPISLTGANTADFSFTTNCPLAPSTLAAGSNCGITPSMNPQSGASGARTASIQVSSDAPTSPDAIALSGTATLPSFSLSTSTEPDFGNVQVGSTVNGNAVTLTNTGVGPLTISSISTIGTNAADFSFTSNCPLSPATLPASSGNTCTITPSMKPQSGATGARTASIQINALNSTSPSTIALTGTGTDFTVTSSAPPPQTVTAGTPATYTLNFATTGGNLAAATSFTCEGLPRLSTCTFSPPSFAAGSPGGNVQLTIATTSNTASQSVASARLIPAPPIPSKPAGGLPPNSMPAVLTLVAVGLVLMAARNRKALRLSAPRLALLALILIAGGYLVGCASGGSGFPEGASGTPPGSYTITVRATSGTVQRTATVTLNVQ